jgi:hypothetical protein
MQVSWNKSDNAKKFEREFEAKVDGKLSEQMSEEVAKLFITRLKENIRKGTLNVIPLKAKTLYNRASRGVSSNRPLFDTRFYINRIVRKGNRVWIRNSPHTGRGEYSNGVSLTTIAKFNEYGRLDLGIPARPVWKLTRLQIGRELKKEMDRVVEKKVKGKKK